MDKNYGMFGLAVQADDLTPADKPLVSFPASDASDNIDADISAESLKLTVGGRDTTVARYISETDSTAHITTLGFPEFLHYMLFAALGSDSVSGEAAPYTHEFSMGEKLPAMTFYQQIGAKNATLQRLDGCKLSNLTIKAEGVTPPSFEFELAGTKANWLEGQTKWTGPDFKVDDGWFTTAGAKVLFSISDGNATEPPSSIVLQSVELQVNNNLEKQMRFGEVDAAKQKEGNAEVTCTIEGTTTDTTIYRHVKTGSETGTNLANEIVTGTVQITFPHTTKKDYSLVVKLPAIPWNIDAMEVDPEGGEFELNLNTDGAVVVNGSSLSALLTTNDSTVLGEVA